jgi:hypothetical protein
MRFHEISSGVRLPVFAEEQAILDKIVDGSHLLKSALSEREQEVARLMVSKGLLDRRKGNEGIYFVANTANDLWRI